MKYSVAQVARTLHVERDLIKTWAFKFVEYMSKDANPSKGIPRKFELNDIRVMAYVLQYWEDDPDIEYIKMGLNSNSHYDHFLIDKLIVEITPVFVDLPEDIDETWTHGVLYDGFAHNVDTYFLAKSYKLAGDRLIEVALETNENRELFSPAIYNYRHAIELYLKATTNSSKQSHDLISLYGKLKDILKSEFNTVPPEWADNLIGSFNNFDPYGTAFRYGSETTGYEKWVDFHQLKRLMGWLAEAFHNIRLHQGITYDL